MPELRAASVDAIARIDAVPLILDAACRLTGMGFAAVARVTEARWIACAVKDDIAFGLEPGGELEVATTICDEIRCSGEPVVIDDVASDPQFSDHHTPRMYGIQSYISFPILLADGRFFGTLCAIDPKPHRVSDPATLASFRLFAELIAMHLDTQERLDRSEAALLGERQTAELRDQFIAVLGHDLRNPLAALAAGTHLLGKAPLDERSASIVRRMGESCRRMGDLIGDVLDFARGKLGGGLVLDRSDDVPLGEALDQVVAELRTVHPDRLIRAVFDIDRPVRCDPRRMMQMLSNLLGNALTHGDPARPVELVARTTAAGFTLSVANGGAAIPADKLARLFQPFTRSGEGKEGLGLGLYIASEIAAAHGGVLTAESDAVETRFTFAMPIAIGARLEAEALS
ncbi:MAG: GAF domain-containing sensor histidine kinase [Pseudomonadota bacterium]